MGIDIYMNWKGKTKEEHQAQITGYANSGSTGYLREAYFRERPYFTEVFFPESWDDPKWKVSAEELKKRLPIVFHALIEKYNNNKWDVTEGLVEQMQELISFVKLAETKEKETGELVWIENSY